MSETKHTAGPWVALRSIPEEGCDGWWIKAQPHAALRGFTHDLAWVNGGQENEANAHLIAAAPDMLEALINLVSLSAPHFTDKPQMLALELARAAIAKATAEGRS